MANKNTPPNFKTFFESVTIDASGSLIVSTLSASYASSSGAGFPYIGYAELTGSLDITQDLIVHGTASFGNAIYLSSSVMYESGSTKFGDTADDTHQFTGSLLVQGSETVTGAIGFTNNTRFNPTQSIQGPGIAVEYLSGSTWIQLGYFAQ